VVIVKIYVNNQVLVVFGSIKYGIFIGWRSALGMRRVALASAESNVAPSVAKPAAARPAGKRPNNNNNIYEAKK
jgi:hypothetical protein